jgi:hypothetical protein
MIGPTVGFELTIKKSKVITDTARTIVAPLSEITGLLGRMILARVQRGQGPYGPWDTYAAHGGQLPAREYFWVMPGRKQPGVERESPNADGLVFKVRSGPWAGWAAYSSVQAYYDLRGLTGRPHDFNESGALMRSAAIRIMSARHVRLAFYGSHGKLSAKAVAWFASRNEAHPLLMPSRAEVQEAQALLAKTVNQQTLEAARLSEQAQGLRARSTSVMKRASKLLAK